MGDRANIHVKDGNSEIYLYTHWDGYRIQDTLKAALKRGESRWHDGSYLTRIIFSEMIKGDIDGTTGYGISSVIGDGDSNILHVDVDQQSITHNNGKRQFFKDYVKDVQ